MAALRFAQCSFLVLYMPLISQSTDHFAALAAPHAFCSAAAIATIIYRASRAGYFQRAGRIIDGARFRLLILIYMIDRRWPFQVLAAYLFKMPGALDLRPVYTSSGIWPLSRPFHCYLLSTLTMPAAISLRLLILYTG